jgi:hypothetical protein
MPSVTDASGTSSAPASSEARSLPSSPSIADLWADLRDVTQRIRPDRDISTPEMRVAWERGERERFFPYGKSFREVVVGLLLGGAATALVRAFPWIGLLVGAALVAVGARLVSGSTLYADVGERVADRLGPVARHADIRGYLAYGLPMERRR